jgi:hypothetical protein
MFLTGVSMYLDLDHCFHGQKVLKYGEFKLGAQTMPTVVCITSWNNQNNIAERQHD